MFNNASVRDILNSMGSTAGINVIYDQQAESAVSRGFTVNLEGVTLEEALNQVLTANGLFYKVVNPRTIIVIPDIPAKRAQYEELVIKTFFLSHADATELTTMINQVARLPGSQPAVMANKTANTITIRTTAALAAVIERVIRANDKPRAEILLDVEILEVNRTRLKEYGLNLSNYAVNLFFSPEQPPSIRRRRDVDRLPSTSTRSRRGSAPPTSISRCRPRSFASSRPTRTRASSRSRSSAARKGRSSR